MKLPKGGEESRSQAMEGMDGGSIRVRLSQLPVSAHTLGNTGYAERYLFLRRAGGLFDCLPAIWYGYSYIRTPKDREFGVLRGSM